MCTWYLHSSPIPFPYFWLFASNSRYFELFSISVEGSSYRESTVCPRKWDNNIGATCQMAKTKDTMYCPHLGRRIISMPHGRAYWSSIHFKIMPSVLKICSWKFLGEEFCISSVMNLAYETIFATFTGKGRLEPGTSDKQLHYFSFNFDQGWRGRVATYNKQLL